MNKYLFGAIALAGLAFTACTSEDVVPAKGDATVNFSVGVPSAMSTRTFADGKTAKNLYYAVYRQGDKTPLMENTAADATVPQFSDELKANLSLSLVTGESYDVVFWAAADNSTHYVFDPATATVTAQAGDANDEGFDAFYAKESFTVSGPSSRPVTLKRPFAQLNIGTSDLENKLVNVTQTAVTVSGVYTQFDLLAGNVTGTSSDVEFKLANIPDATKESFPVEPATYKYVSMNYLMVDNADAELHKVTFTHDNSTGTNPMVYDNVPMKPNYRTNIYGAIFTDEQKFQIDIVPDFTNPSIDIIPETYTEQVDLSKGGNFNVEEAVNEIVIPDNLAAPLYLNLQSKVGKIKIGNNAQPVVIKVEKDVEYPDFSYDKTATVTDLTIVGDPTSSKPISRFDYMNFTNEQIAATQIAADRIPVDCPAKFVNLTFKGVVFEGRGFEPQYSCSTENVVFSDCRFINMEYSAIGTQQNGASTRFTCKDITFENCLIDFKTDAIDSANGMYLMDIIGNVVLRNNTINNAPYHAISVTGFKDYPNKTYPTNVSITGNKISGCGEDGIKVASMYDGSSVYIDNNTINGTKVNGIRIKAMTVSGDITVTNNNIDMRNAKEFKDGEPSAIILDKAVTSGKVVVKDNVITNSNGHDLTSIESSPIQIADGMAMTADGNYEVSSKAGLMSLKKFVMEDDNTFSGKTVKLTANIDLGNEAWIPLGNGLEMAGAWKKVFNGTFDGGNHTIYNLNVDNKNDEKFGTDKNYKAGFFGCTGPNAVIKNIKFENATINTIHYAGVVAGQSYGKFDNVHVTKATVTSTYVNEDASGDKVGGILGQAGEGNSIRFVDCSVTNSTISAGRDAGQMCGMSASYQFGDGNSATNVKVQATPGGSGKNIKEELFGRSW